MTAGFLAVGRVTRPHGVRGEMVLELMTEFPEHLAEHATVYLGEAAEPHALQQARPHRGGWLIRLGDCQSREAAEAWRGQLVQIRQAQAAPLPPGRYYHHQIIGLEVFTEAGERLGVVSEKSDRSHVVL